MMTRTKSGSSPDIPSLDDNLIKKMCEFMQPLITDTIREEIHRSLEPMISSLREEVKNLKEEVERKNNQIHVLQHTIDSKTDELEQYQRRNSLRIFGYTESDRENTDDIAIQVAQTLKVDLSYADIDRSHRVGRKIEGRERPIIVKFTSYRKRAEVFRAKRLLINTKITVREDLTKKRVELLRKCIDKFGLKNVWTQDGTIIVKDKNYKIRINCDADFLKLCNSQPATN